MQQSETLWWSEKNKSHKWSLKRFKSEGDPVYNTPAITKTLIWGLGKLAYLGRWALKKTA